MKRIIVSSIIGGALALASISGIAQAATPAQTTVSTEQRGGPGGGKHDGQNMLAGSLIKQTVTTTGLTAAEVTTQLKAGKSLTQIAQSKSKTEAEIIAAVRKELKTRVDTAVTNKRITQERADQMLAEFDKNAPTVMQDTTLGQKITDRQDHRQQGAAMQILIQATSEVTGLTPAEVRAQLKAGKSLAQIAESKGKTAADVLAKAKEIVAARQQAILDDAANLVNQTNTQTTTPTTPAP